MCASSRCGEDKCMLDTNIMSKYPMHKCSNCNNALHALCIYKRSQDLEQLCYLCYIMQMKRILPKTVTVSNIKSRYDIWDDLCQHNFEGKIIGRNDFGYCKRCNRKFTDEHQLVWQCKMENLDKIEANSELKKIAWKCKMQICQFCYNDIMK